MYSTSQKPVSIPYEPYSFSSWAMTIGPPFEYRYGRSLTKKRERESN